MKNHWTYNLAYLLRTYMGWMKNLYTNILITFHQF
ncbi:MAG: hypothetical protein RL757_1213 [Bacteroidota bacterium]|jgi:hypothetical protein